MTDTDSPLTPEIPPENAPETVTEGQNDLLVLKAEKEALQAEIEQLRVEKEHLLREQQDLKAPLQELVQLALTELQEKRQSLEITVEQLEKRRDRIKEEMRSTFAGVSQELAVRVQGFKDYLVGSLQDLASVAEQLELPSYETPATPPPPPTNNQPQPVKFGDSQFQEQTRKIRQLLDQYRTNPDYYGPPWQLRRTFEPIHAERVQNWFFNQGGRGALRTMGSRLQNILISSAIISVLYKIHGERLRTLVLANSPERLGEWRRGLQDCLGISRSDFGPERGMILFESADALIQKADRIVEDEDIPFVIVDETETEINMGLLQFPLWLAFAPEPQVMPNYYY